MGMKNAKCNDGTPIDTLLLLQYITGHIYIYMYVLQLQQCKKNETAATTKTKKL